MSVLLQISDPHFGTEQPAVVAALTVLVQRERPDVLVLSGDITQRARPAQFAAARRFVDRLGIPRVLALPGNHDIPLFDVVARAFYPYARYQRAFGATLEPELETDELLVLCVNTTRRYRHIDGEISPQQIERVARRLATASARQLRVVVTHQPVHVAHAQDAHDLVHGHQAAVRAWTKAGADILMGGHIHLPYVRSLSERFDDLPRAAWCVQAGTALSWRVRPDAPNSVNLLRYGLALRAGLALDEGCCEVERWDHSASTARFEKVDVARMRLARA